MQRTLRMTPQARRDIKLVVDGLFTFSERAAERLSLAFDRRLNTLCVTPMIGRSRDEFRLGMRSIVIDSYLVFFTSGEDFVQIIRVIHGFT